jgi:hypothetical protein
MHLLPIFQLQRRIIHVDVLQQCGEITFTRMSDEGLRSDPGLSRKKCNRITRSEAVTSLNVKVTIVWHVTPCDLVDPYQRFEGR